MNRFSSLALAVLLASSTLSGQEAAAKPAATQAQGLTLEKLFPEDGLFGPQATGMAFSADGAYAAWLYRPLRERRHGGDLWLYDIAKDELQRLTAVSVMAPFQQATRKVMADRVERARKVIAKEKADAGGKTAKGEPKAKGEQATKDDRLSGDWVTDDDFKQKEAPRYDGVSSFDWAPAAAELLFTSGGDVYRYTVAGQKLERFTQTRESERQVQWLPDGQGFTFMRGEALVKVTLGSHVVAQIDPRLPPGETIGGYELSPDGTALAFLTSKGTGGPGAGMRKVNIVSYRDRFATVREVPRTVSDDAVPERTVSFYVVELSGALAENGELTRVFQHKITGPRDIVRTPEWSPDGKRVAFAVFDQQSEQVRVMVAERQAAATPEKKSADTDEKAAVGGVEAERGDGQAKESGDNATAKNKKEGEPVDRPARVVLRFLHAGGPNTPSMIRPQFLADNRRLVMVTEQSGFRHVHLFDPLYEQLDQLTRGRYEVYPVDLSKDRKTLFVTANKEAPSHENVYAIDLESGAMRRVDVLDGNWSHVAVSPDGGTLLGTFTTFGRVPELHLVRVAGATSRVLTDSHSEETRKLVEVKPVFFSYENRHGHVIHGHMFKPADQKPGDKRPLLVYVYGGPLGTRKTVEDGSYHGSAYLFARYMTERHGWVTCSIDPRGQSGYGSVFEKANFEQVGKPQVEDLVDGVKWFVADHDVDEKRVALHGWSFGGFQTQMCLYTEPGVFAAGIAGAGPTEWENYNNWYSQGTIGKTRTGAADLKKFSLLPLAKNLRARLLLVHGMEDSNVLYQDTVRVYRELLKAGKEALVDLFLDPTGGHGLGGDVKHLNRYRKYEDFLVTHVGEGKPVDPAEKVAPPAGEPGQGAAGRGGATDKKKTIY
ncbi:MAG: prolyl oligopeptidase family serine peptidase [Planctomycetota bacterium]